MKSVKQNFFNLLHRAIKPEQVKDETSESKRPDDYSETQTRLDKTVGTSDLQRDESQK